MQTQETRQNGLDPDPALNHLFSRIDGDPVISQALFSRFDSDPSIEGALFGPFGSDPAIKHVLFSQGVDAL